MGIRGNIFECGMIWVLPPLCNSNSWIILVIQLYIVLNIPLIQVVTERVLYPSYDYTGSN